jgi:hypothetical protein
LLAFNAGATVFTNELSRLTSSNTKTDKGLSVPLGFAVAAAPGNFS